MTRLTFFERQQIESWLKTGVEIREIGRRLKRDHSVIVREIKRNKPQTSPYNAELAQKATRRKAGYTNTRKLDKDWFFRDWVERKLMLNWSPEQVSGRLKKYHPGYFEGTISPEAIYSFIYDKSGDNEWLYHYLRRSHSKRKRKFARKPKKVLIPDRVGIEERPEVINRRERYGDWESDTMVFKKQKLALSVQYERKSQLVRINKIIDRSAEETTEALHKTAESLPKELFLSLTLDNGVEGTRHTEIKEMYGIDTYFCMAYASWQKGGVENGNGLIRQYFPRTTDMNTISDKQVQKVQELLNDRPRKGLDYQTPNEIANKLIKGGALNS